MRNIKKLLYQIDMFHYRYIVIGMRPNVLDKLLRFFPFNVDPFLVIKSFVKLYIFYLFLNMRLCLKHMSNIVRSNIV